MKRILLLPFLLIAGFLKAQKIEQLFVNLYTDSLKKGTYNYINIDGLLLNGKYLPLDSTHISFSSSAGVFYGNQLWVAPDFNESKITISVTLKENTSLRQTFDMYIKQLPDGPLKTKEALLKELQKH